MSNAKVSLTDVLLNEAEILDELVEELLKEGTPVKKLVPLSIERVREFTEYGSYEAAIRLLSSTRRELSR